MPSFIMFAFIYLVIILSIFYVAVVMFQVYKGVNSIERKSERYSFVRYTAATKKKKKMDMSQRVMIQGLLYTLALILIFLFPLIGIIMVLVTGKSVVVVDFLIVTFYPLQGKVLMLYLFIHLMFYLHCIFFIKMMTLTIPPVINSQVFSTH